MFKVPDYNPAANAAGVPPAILATPVDTGRAGAESHPSPALPSSTGGPEAGGIRRIFCDPIEEWEID